MKREDPPKRQSLLVHVTVPATTSAAAIEELRKELAVVGDSLITAKGTKLFCEKIESRPASDKASRATPKDMSHTVKQILGDWDTRRRGLRP